MSFTYVQLSDEGNTVDSVITSAHPYDPSILFDLGLIEVDTADADFLKTAMFVTDESGVSFIQRPTLPPMLEVVGGYSISDLPENATCTITDTLNGEMIHTFTATVLEPTFEFSLADAGQYQVEVDCAGGYLSALYDLEVSDD